MESAFPAGKPVFALLNVRSGWADGSACRDQLKEALQSQGLELRVEQAVKGFDITAAIRRAREEGIGAVIAGGGDGTLNAVAAGLNGSDVPMAILPMGTLNHLARDLQVPLKMEEAIEQLRHCQPVRIDLGEVNGRVFINNSVIGLYPTYWFTRMKIQRAWKSHWVAIASAIFTVIRRNPNLKLRLTANGQEIVRSTPYVLIANNEHRMEGYQLGTRDRLDRGLLWVYVMRKLSRWGLLKLAASLIFGRFRKAQDFETFPVSSVRIESRRKRLGVSLDGEVKLLRTPLEYRSLPGALRMIAPAAALEKVSETSE